MAIYKVVWFDNTLKEKELRAGNIYQALSQLKLLNSWSVLSVTMIPEIKV